ncbi:Rs1 [Symbiodinium microadriaticum]|nr:Rs1 [Symbiodinium microadriaticum]
MQRGLKAEFFFGLKPSTVSCLLPDVSMRQPDYVRLDAQLDYASSGHWDGITESDHLSARWTGFLNIKHAGLYKFYVSADDSVEFFLDGNLVIQETRCGVHSSLLEEVLSYYQTLNPKPQHFSYHLSSQHPFGVPPSMAHT